MFLCQRIIELELLNYPHSAFFLVWVGPVKTVNHRPSLHLVLNANATSPQTVLAVV